MKLKKINEKLQEALIENGLTEANVLQQETFSTIKSGADCIILSPGRKWKIDNNCFECDSAIVRSY